MTAATLGGAAARTARPPPRLRQPPSAVPGLGRSDDGPPPHLRCQASLPLAMSSVPLLAASGAGWAVTRGAPRLATAVLTAFLSAWARSATPSPRARSRSHVHPLPSSCPHWTVPSPPSAPARPAGGPGVVSCGAPRAAEVGGLRTDETWVPASGAHRGRGAGECGGALLSSPALRDPRGTRRGRSLPSGWEGAQAAPRQPPFLRPFLFQQ